MKTKITFKKTICINTGKEKILINKNEILAFKDAKNRQVSKKWNMYDLSIILEISEFFGLTKDELINQIAECKIELL